MQEGSPTEDVGEPPTRPVLRRSSFFGLFYRIVRNTLAVIGLFWIGGNFVLPKLVAPMFRTAVVNTVHAPDNRALAKVEVRSGGFGTVNSTRVFLKPVGREPWTVYQTQDSDFPPPLRWLDNQTLLIGLPCARFDHISNPDDWERADASDRRYKVRVEYPGGCLNS